MKFFPGIYFSNWIQAFWLLLTLGIGAFGSIALLSPKWTFLRDLVMYGKSQSSERSLFHRSIEVPKRWFTHFYILATSITTTVTFYVATAYLCDAPPGKVVQEFIQWIAGPRTKANVAELDVLLTFTCLTIHVIRRLFESLFLSVYSDTRMNILHYVVGWLHYVMVPLTILAEAPGFAEPWQKHVKWNSITVLQIFGLIIFFISNYYQHQCLLILAAMRRNYLGNITNYAHGIPVTGWFDYVSCPHFFFEILIYISLYLTLNTNHHLWTYVVIFVLINQIIAARITHAWYKDKYKHSYPESRTALIPYVL